MIWKLSSEKPYIVFRQNISRRRMQRLQTFVCVKTHQISRISMGKKSIIQYFYNYSQYSLILVNSSFTLSNWKLKFWLEGFIWITKLKCFFGSYFRSNPLNSRLNIFQLINNWAYKYEQVFIYGIALCAQVTGSLMLQLLTLEHGGNYESLEFIYYSLRKNCQ